MYLNFTMITPLLLNSFHVKSNLLDVLSRQKYFTRKTTPPFLHPGVIISPENPLTCWPQLQSKPHY